MPQLAAVLVCTTHVIHSIQKKGTDYFFLVCVVVGIFFKFIFYRQTCSCQISSSSSRELHCVCECLSTIFTFFPLTVFVWFLFWARCCQTLFQICVSLQHPRRNCVQSWVGEVKDVRKTLSHSEFCSDYSSLQTVHIHRVVENNVNNNTT